MKNVDMRVVRNGKNKLIIEVDLDQEFGKSSSGKTTIIASTEGNVSLPDPAFEHIKVGLNVYKK